LTPVHLRLSVRRLAIQRLGLLLLVALVAGCSSSPSPEMAFCDRLALATGPEGAEILFDVGSPERMTATTDELRGLQELAPSEITATMATLVDIFELVADTPSDDVPALLIEREQTLATASDDLTSYALRECNLFLQRAS